MVRNLVLATLLLVALTLMALSMFGLHGAIQVASADGAVDWSKYEIWEAQSIVAENHYSILNQHGIPGNYDIHHTGEICYRWIRAETLAVVFLPRIVTYSYPIDDFDLINIISCQS